MFAGCQKCTDRRASLGRHCQDCGLKLAASCPACNSTMGFRQSASFMGSRIWYRQFACDVCNHLFYLDDERTTLRPAPMAREPDCPQCGRPRMYRCQKNGNRWRCWCCGHVERKAS